MKYSFSVVLGTSKHLLSFLTSSRHSLIILMLALFSANSAHGKDVEFSYSVYQNKGGASGTGGNATETVDGVTISSTKAYYDGNSRHVREYQGSVITFASSNNITKIVVSATTDAYATAFGGKVSTGTYSTNKTIGTWTGNAQTISFTTTAQSRWTNIVVTTQDAQNVYVNWYSNGEFFTTTTCPQGNYATAPTNNPTIPQGCEGKVFAGWTSHQTIKDGEEPDDIFTVKSTTTILDDNTSFYAVFATLESSTEAKTDSYNYSFKKDEGWTSGNGVQTLGNINWTLSTDAGYFARTGGTTGMQIGSSNNSATYINLSTDGISGTINSVTVATRGASGVNANIGVKVNGISYIYYDSKNNDSEVTSISSTSNSYTFKGSDKGTIEINWKVTSKTAIYITQIIINYTEVEEAKTYKDYSISCDEDKPQIQFTDVSAPSWITSSSGLTVKAATDGLIKLSDKVDKDEITYSFSDNSADDIFSVTINDYDENLGGYPYSVTYTPNDYGITETPLTFSVGAATSEEITLHGRSLPEKFVIAAKVPGTEQWVALPNTLANVKSNQNSIVPIEINVNQDAMMAIEVPQDVIYQVAPTKNDKPATTLSITDGTNYLQADPDNSTYKMWLAKTQDNNQDWLLLSEDFTKYEITIPEIAGRRIALYSNNKYMGYHSTPTDIYLLPYDKIKEPSLTDITVVEWGENSIVVSVVENNKAKIDDIATVKLSIEGTTTEAITPQPINFKSINGAKNLKITTSLNFTNSAYERQPLNIDWYNKEGAKIASSMVVVPMIISDTESSTGDLSSAEIHLLPNSELNITGVSGTINKVVIYPNATLKVENNTTINELVLRNGWTRADFTQEQYGSYGTANVVVESGSLTATKAYIDLDIFDGDKHYYPFAVPCEVKIKDIDYADKFLADASKYGSEGQYVFKYYDGAKRAEYGANINDNWVELPETETETLKPGVGYIVTAVAVKGDATLRIPITDKAWNTSNNKVDVKAYTGVFATANKVHGGWNMIGVPFSSQATMSEIKINEIEIEYVSVPTPNFDDYKQEVAKSTPLKAGYSFFVQAGKTGEVTFEPSTAGSATGIVARHSQTSVHTVWAEINLTDGQAEDKTTLLINDKYSTDYEVGADLEKMFGTGLAVYTISPTAKLVFNALPTTATENIPLGYRAPKAGEYMFSLPEDMDMTDIEGVYLTDNIENRTYNLLWSDYIFYTSAGENNSRFSLWVKTKAPEITTDIEQTADNDWRFNVHSLGNRIMVRQLPSGADVYVYSTDGKLVYSEQSCSATRLEIDVPTTGVYSIRVINKGEAKTAKALIK